MGVSGFLFKYSRWTKSLNHTTANVDAAVIIMVKGPIWGLGEELHIDVTRFFGGGKLGHTQWHSGITSGYVLRNLS